ncbi:MAG: hypothetical protein V9F02_09995, partial [Chitinophagaceae bacterium]
VGTVAYGDIEADPNSNKIYMVNLFQRRLIVFDASAATATLNAASTTTLVLSVWPIVCHGYAIRIYCSWLEAKRRKTDIYML